MLISLFILFHSVVCLDHDNGLSELTTKKITLTNSRMSAYLYKDENLVIKKRFSDYAATFAAAHTGIALCAISTKFAGLFALGIGLYEIYQDFWHIDKTLVYKRNYLNSFDIFVQHSCNEWKKNTICQSIHINDKLEVLLLYDTKNKLRYISNIPHPCGTGCHVYNCSAYWWNLRSCTNKKNINFYDSVRVNVFDKLKKFYIKEYPQHHHSFIILKKDDDTYHIFLHENNQTRLSTATSIENVIHVSLAQEFPAYAVEYLKKVNPQQANIGPSVIHTARNIDVGYWHGSHCTIENAHLIGIRQDGSDIYYLQKDCMKRAKISWNKDTQQSTFQVTASIPFKFHKRQILVKILSDIHSQKIPNLNFKDNLLNNNIRHECINETLNDLNTKLLLRMPLSKVFAPKPYPTKDN